MEAKWIRLYTDEQGISQFEERAEPLDKRFDVNGKGTMFTNTFLEPSSTFFQRVVPGWDGSRHCAPRRQILVTLQGEYEVTLDDGTSKRFPKGAVLLAEDTTGAGHRTKVTSEDELLLFAVVLPDEG